MKEIFVFALQARRFPHLSAGMEKCSFIGISERDVFPQRGKKISFLVRLLTGVQVDVQDGKLKALKVNFQKGGVRKKKGKAGT